MTDSYNGFAFLAPPWPWGIKARGTRLTGAQSITVTRGINVRNNPPQRQLLVIAKDVHRAIEIARTMMLRAIFVDAGPAVLARARKLGIRDDEAGIDEGRWS